MGHDTVYVIQVVDSTMYIQGPLYRYVDQGRNPFTMRFAMEVLASAFYVSAITLPLVLHWVTFDTLQHRAAKLAEQLQALHAPATALTTPSRSNSLFGCFSQFMRGLRRVWDEVRLATCRSVQVRYPNGTIVKYDRSEAALTGPVASSRLYPLLRRLGQDVFATLNVEVDECLDGGEMTFAWRGTIGSTSVVIKMDLMPVDNWTEREVTREWNRLAFALPRDARVASALPIPAYYGLFEGAQASIILMSDCGHPIDNFPDLEEHLQ